MAQRPLSAWITVPEASRLAGVGIRAIQTLIHQKRLSVRLVPGSYRRVRRSEVEALVESCTTPAAVGSGSGAGGPHTAA